MWLAHYTLPLHRIWPQICLHLLVDPVPERNQLKFTARPFNPLYGHNLSTLRDLFLTSHNITLTGLRAGALCVLVQVSATLMRCARVRILLARAVEYTASRSYGPVSLMSLLKRAWYYGKISLGRKRSHIAQRNISSQSRDCLTLLVRMSSLCQTGSPEKIKRCLVSSTNIFRTLSYNYRPSMR